jgi:hypothetical protein
LMVAKDFKWQKSEKSTIAIEEGSMDYALTTGHASLNALKNNPKPTINGKGLGLDMGFSVLVPDEDGEEEDDYLWKFGVSILDLGAINFNKNAQKHHLDFIKPVIFSEENFLHQEDLNATLQDISSLVLGNAKATMVDNSFKIGLPTSISMQFDRKIAPRYYISALVMQRLAMKPTRLKRANYVAIAPRYDKKLCSISLPIHVIDGREVRIGVAARIGGFVLGSDHLKSLVRTKRLSGADFYFGLKINNFSMKTGNRERGLKQKNRHWHRESCYKF